MLKHLHAYLWSNVYIYIIIYNYLYTYIIIYDHIYTYSIYGLNLISLGTVVATEDMTICFWDSHLQLRNRLAAKVRFVYSSCASWNAFGTEMVWMFFGYFRHISRRLIKFLMSHWDLSKHRNYRNIWRLQLVEFPATFQVGRMCSCVCSGTVFHEVSLVVLLMAPWADGILGLISLNFSRQATTCCHQITSTYRKKNKQIGAPFYRASGNAAFCSRLYVWN